MLGRYRLLVTVALVILSSCLALDPLAAQWVGYPTARVPRKADGTLDMAAPTPRLADGKPDLSRIWTAANPSRQKAGEDVPSDGNDIASSPQMANSGVDLPGGSPYQAWLVPIVKEHTANLAIDDPHIRCLPDNFIRAYGLPHLLKFVHTQDLLVELIDEICLENEQFVERMRPLSSAQE